MKAFLNEMVRLASADGPSVVCLQEVPIWALGLLDDWSGMAALGAVAQRPTLGPFPSTPDADRYYPATGRMGVTPGQQELQPTSVPEAAGLVYKSLDADTGILRCFECHSTGPVDISAGAIRPAEAGVHCEACHGPGAAHRVARDRASIRNPKRMAAAASPACRN